MIAGRFVRQVVALAVAGVSVAVNVVMDRMGLTVPLSWMSVGMPVAVVIVLCAARLLQLLAVMLFRDRTAGDVARHAADVLLCGWIIAVCRRVNGVVIVPAEWAVMAVVSGLLLVCLVFCWLDGRGAAHDDAGHVL